MGSDSLDLVDAVMNPTKWPRFRGILQQISAYVAFETESASSNKVVREIAKSVLRDGRFHSYLARGGPAWLHKLIRLESSLSS